ncbi:MAG TPA: class I SAM-dependent methyltransferase [Acidimicrobiales bacterium]|nr:class I SAM-dependent methyltransferase [Acidimicrobiales bacterium]
MDAADWDRRYDGAGYVWEIEPNRFVAEQVLPLAPGRALDLGAGEGRNAVWLATRGWDATAVDFSTVGVEKAARLAADHDVSVRTVVADALTYEVGACAWDLVLLSYLQLPTDERLAVVRRAAAGVAPGGTLLVIAHDRTNLERGYGGPQDPDVLYDVDETVAAIAGADGEDLEPVVRTVVGRLVTKDDGEHVALDTLVVARRR